MFDDHQSEEEDDDKMLNVQQTSSTPAGTLDSEPDDDAMLHPNGIVDSSAKKPIVVKFRHEYPNFRYSVGLRIVIFLSSLITLVLWLTGELVNKWQS